MGSAHSHWMIAPGPWMPFAMVKLAPDNQTQGWCAGYDYGIEHVDCFSHIHDWTLAGLGLTFGGRKQARPDSVTNCLEAEKGWRS